MSRWTMRRTAAVTAATLLVTALGAGAARADDPAPTSSPNVTTSVDGDQVTITTDLATAQAACAKVGTAERRLNDLIARIQGDAGTKGSAAWLRARAQHATDEGRPDQANVLDARATRRAGWVDDLQRAVARLQKADRTVCDALPAAGR